MSSNTQCKAIAENWQVILSELVQEAEELAQTVQRERKLDVETLVQSLVLGCLEKPDASLRDFVQAAHDLGVDVVASSFHDRLTPRAVMLLASLLDLSLKRKLAPPRDRIPSLRAFAGVYIVDSTQITLCEALYEVFCGSQGAAKMKVHAAYDYQRGQVQMVDCVAGNESDQKYAQWQDLIQPKALLLFDLGYFKQERLAEIHHGAAFFVTRCQSQVGLYDPSTKEKVALVDNLRQTTQDTFEGTFCLGSRVKLPVRVIARRVDQQVAQARRRRAKRRAKEQGQTCSRAYLEWLAWDVMVTNLPDTWLADDILLLYGIRWQIEIVFKVWKSRLGVARLGNWRPQRVMCQFYAHLLGAVLCHNTIALLRCHSSALTSLAKAVSVIQQHLPSLHPVIRRNWRGLLRWATELRAVVLQFAQHDKRNTTPTTLQILMDWG